MPTVALPPKKVKVKELPSQLSWLRIHLQCKIAQFNSWVGKISWKKDRLPTPVSLGFPCGSACKESACNVGDLGSTLGWEDPLEEDYQSSLAWRIPRTEEPGRQQFVGSQRGGQDCVTKHSTAFSNKVYFILTNNCLKSLSGFLRLITIIQI